MRGRVLLAVAAVVALAGCGFGSGNDSAQAPTDSPASRVPPPSATATATGSGDPEFDAAVSTYRAYVIRQAAQLRVDGRKFTDAVRAGNMAEAKMQFAPSRARWEAIEPIAVLVSRYDISLDARVDNYASVSDPDWTGWHKLEYLIWVKNTTAGGTALADKIDRDLASLQKAVGNVKITPQAVVKGAGDLVAEVSDGKITGEEDRYSHTDLSDFAANVSGAKAAYSSFRPLLQQRRPDLVSTVDTSFAAVEASLGKYKAGATYKPYRALAPDDKLKMQAHLASLSENLALVPSALSLI